MKKIEIIIDKVDKNVRGGGGYGYQVKVDNQITDAFCGCTKISFAIECSLKILKRLKKDVKK